VNELISKALKDEDTLDKLQRPCSIFATFKSEEGYQRALEYNNTILLPDFEQYKTLLD